MSSFKRFNMENRNRPIHAVGLMCTIMTCLVTKLLKEQRNEV